MAVSLSFKAPGCLQEWQSLGYMGIWCIVAQNQLKASVQAPMHLRGQPGVASKCKVRGLTSPHFAEFCSCSMVALEGWPAVAGLQLSVTCA